MFEIVDATSSASQQNQWTRLTFSPDGRNLLVTTANGSLLVIDAFEGHVRQVIRPSGGLSKMPLPADASFTPDARHLIHGADGKISAWDAETGRLVGELEAVGHAKGLPLMVRMNPRFCMMASACTQLVDCRILIDFIICMFVRPFGCQMMHFHNKHNSFYN